MAFKLGMCSHLAQVGVQSFPIVLGGHARAISQSFLNVSRPLCGQRLRNHTWIVAVSCWTSAATIGLHLSVRFFRLVAAIACVVGACCGNRYAAGGWVTLLLDVGLR